MFWSFELLENPKFTSGNRKNSYKLRCGDDREQEWVKEYSKETDLTKDRVSFKIHKSKYIICMELVIRAIDALERLLKRLLV